MGEGIQSSTTVAAPPRLLHRCSQYGYTDRLDKALAREPEAVPREEQQLITARSRRTARQAQVEEWAARRAVIQREVDWLYSQRLQRDVSGPLRTLRRQLERIDRAMGER